MKIRFKKELQDAKMPYKKHDGDFCYDFYAATDAQPVYDDDGNVIPNVWCYDTGISYEIIRDNEPIEVVYEGDENGDGKICRNFNFKDSPLRISIDARPRSSIYKTGLILSNCEGTLDEPYRGHVKAIFYHVIPSLPKYKKGDRIFQAKIGITLPIDWEEVETEWETTTRGEGGFGSTGKD